MTFNMHGNEGGGGVRSETITRGRKLERESIAI